MSASRVSVRISNKKAAVKLQESVEVKLRKPRANKVQESDADNLQETCAICCESIDPVTQKIVSLHKDPKNQWAHNFHDICIDGWYLACLNNNKTPCCPLCPSVMFPNTYRPLLQGQPQKNALELFQNIRLSYNVCPYIGIMVCINGDWKLKLTNLNLFDHKHEWDENLPYHHELTLGHIKRKIVSMGKYIYDKFGNQNETWKETLSYLMYDSCPKLKPIYTSYIIPPRRVSFGEMEMNNIDDDSSLKDMYIDYHTKLEELKCNPNTDPKTLQLIDNISTKKNITYIPGSTRYDYMTDSEYEVPGYWETGYVNPENPHVIRAKYNPWAWIAIHLEYEAS